jgi:hypothetical protein
MNPYLVVKNLDINQVQDELNAKWNQGYKALEVLVTGNANFGGNFSIVFVMKTAEASAERSTVAGGGSSN